MSPCDIPFCSRYPRIVVPILIEIETASPEPLAILEGIVCISAISHKVNTDNHLVNDYLRGFADSRTSPGSSIVIYPFKPEPLLEAWRHEPVSTLPNSYHAESNMWVNFLTAQPPVPPTDTHCKGPPPTPPGPPPNPPPTSPPSRSTATRSPHAPQATARPQG